MGMGGGADLGEVKLGGGQLDIFIFGSDRKAHAPPGCAGMCWDGKICQICYEPAGSAGNPQENEWDKKQRAAKLLDIGGKSLISGITSASNPPL